MTLVQNQFNHVMIKVLELIMLIIACNIKGLNFFFINMHNPNISILIAHTDQSVNLYLKTKYPSPHNETTHNILIIC